jgi:hypothetical protein
MTTMDELIRKHANLLRCKPVDKGGCGEEKPKEEFPIYYDYNDVGQRKRRLGSWCKACRSRRNAANKKPPKNEGPTGAEKEFFCRVVPTVTEKIKRYATYPDER